MICDRELEVTEVLALADGEVRIGSQLEPSSALRSTYLLCYLTRKGRHMMILTNTVESDPKLLDHILHARLQVDDVIRTLG